MNKLKTLLLVLCFFVVSSLSAQKFVVEIQEDGLWQTYEDTYLEQVYKIFLDTDVDSDITFKCVGQPSDFFSQNKFRFKFIPSVNSIDASGWSYTWSMDGLVVSESINETLGFSIADFADLGVGINDFDKKFTVTASKPGQTSVSRVFKLRAVKMGDRSFVASDSEDRCTANHFELSIDEGTNYIANSNIGAFLFREDELVFQSPDYIIPNMPLVLFDDMILYEDINYTGVVVDRFGFRWDSNTVLKEAIACKADFDVTFYDNNASLIDEGDVNSAPVVVKFVNQSLNATSYEWFVYKPSVAASSSNEDDYLLKADSSSDIAVVEADGSLNYKYNVSGSDFNIKLVSYSDDKVCSNTIIKPLFSDAVDGMTIESLIEIPSIFIAADGEAFKIKKTFVHDASFEGYIFSRAGKKLYEFKNIDDGWDGSVSGKDAPSGMYFYVFRVTGLEDDVIEKTGSFMMMRAK